MANFEDTSESSQTLDNRSFNKTFSIAERLIYGSDGSNIYAIKTNSDGELVVNLEASSINIGDVDVVSQIPGTGATNLGKAEDAVHASGDTGVQALGVRNDELATLVDADGDYAPLQVDSEGALWTHPKQDTLVDDDNSTTDVLDSDEVFTGDGQDVLDCTTVTITLDSSHDSATDGMTFQFSTDNSNWDDVYTFTYTAADGARRFQFPVTSQFFRVVYTNGGTLQTHLRIQTICHKHNQLTSIHRLADDTSPDRSAQVMKSAIIAQKGGGGPSAGDFVPVQATSAGNLKMSLQEASDGMDIGAGNAGSETLRVSVSTDDVNLAAINTATATPTAMVAFVTDVPTAGSRVQLGSNAIVGCVIQAPSTNTGIVYIGGSNVSSTVFGAELQPGQSTGFAGNNTNLIYIDAATSGDDVAVIGS